MRFALACLTVAALLVGAVDAKADSLFTVGASVSGSGFGDNGSPAGPNTRWAADSFRDDRFALSAESVSRADVGSMAGHVGASIAPNGGPAVGQASARSSAFFLLDGIIVTRLPGFEALPATVETTARFTFDPGSTFERFTDFSGGLSGGSEFALGAVSSAMPTATSTAQLIVGQPYSLTAALQMRSSVSSAFGTQIGSFRASLDRSHAFVVPEGYVVNAPDGMVVDNVYLGTPVSITAGVEGDYNFDGLVDAADYTVWRDTFSTGGDLPNDTTPEDVTTADYDLWSASYGGPLSGGSPTPEPGSACLLVIAGLTTTVRHRWQRAVIS